MKDEFEKGLTPWTEFAHRCIVDVYEGQGGQSIADKEVSMGDKTITKAEQLGSLLERENIQQLTRIQVFDCMDQLRREAQVSA